MPYALVMIEMPENQALWPLALGNIRRSKELPAGATQLPGYSWLIDLSVGLSFFGTLLRHIEAASPDLFHNVAFFEQKPNFTKCAS